MHLCDVSEKFAGMGEKKEELREAKKEAHICLLMGISKTEINLKRLLAAAPQQQNQAKLIHYVATMRELLEQLAEETTPEELPRISKAEVNDYSEKIESIASKLAAPREQEPFAEAYFKETPPGVTEKNLISPPGLRKRPVTASIVEDRSDQIVPDSSTTIKLDSAGLAHVEKHRKLQEDLTDEMVGLAQQLKESTLMMSRSLQNTEKIIDSTEKAVEDSLARTSHSNVRAAQMYSESSKTSCLQWLIILVMTLVFIMVVLLIRVT
ncbi:hypothetical protein Nepgr_021501 [Nepenthes gracilis]|uniref:Vesicle transport protein USE1 n=1 Tax=Nepenthes gracilis TaxID=150966 RepID=A0AAD3SYR8_NEPGR|nr:hypothetical protein Nepgr_021501 [Nepenthes gracilis]